MVTLMAQRPLLIGVLLAVIAVVAWTTWQMLRNRKGASLSDTANAAMFDRAESTQDGKVSESGHDKTDDDPYANKRRQMVHYQIAARDVTDQRVLKAMRQVPRHLFVPKNYLSQAYEDHPLPIGHDQTISQPYIVAIMSQLAKTHDKAVALDIGTGSGYQAAILSELCGKVYSIEIVEELAKSARERLAGLGYRNVTVRHGDGYRGWPEHAPFDVIIVAAAPRKVPQPLIDQLKAGGRLVIPVGKYYQSLTLIEKHQDGSVTQRNVIPVSFVPMTGEAEKGKVP
jgi:protein-L-isoaspartate(D-aspartate) O-methyltransferase